MIWRSVQQKMHGCEIAIWLPCATLSYFMASYLSYGWPYFLSPFNSMLNVYVGDALLHSWFSQRILEGNLFENVRNGYPFGSTFLDFPGSDSGSFILTAVIGIFSDDGFTINVIYFLTGFPLCWIATYIVARKIGLNKIISILLAFAFVFSSFHFSRREHLFYTFYFVVPLYFYIAYIVFINGLNFEFISIQRIAIFILVSIIVASFGIYYAVFGLILIAFSGAAGYLRLGKPSSAVLALIFIFSILTSVAGNLYPYVEYSLDHGKDVEMAQRSPAESETYGLKLIQLILPQGGHRISYLGDIATRYAKTRPLSNENMTSSLGLLGSVGLASCFIFLIKSSLGQRINERLIFFSLTAYILFITGTIGGFGAIFASTFSSSIRAWNRVSIFIAFAAQASLFIFLQIAILKINNTKKRNYILYSVVFVALSIIWIDQTKPACTPCIVSADNKYKGDIEYYSRIESDLPRGSAIYQLPYMPIPEVPLLNQLSPYDNLRPFLDTKFLRWNLGGTKGRFGDLFYRSLSGETIDRQIEVIRKLGFSGILVNRLGYADSGSEIIEALRMKLGTVGMDNSRQDEIYFEIKDHNPIVPSSASVADIMRTAGYEINENGQHIASNLYELVDFSKAILPSFIAKVEGLSGVEPWGRWSDAELAPEVKLTFDRDLPNQFNLWIRADAFGPNVGEPVRMSIGNQQFDIAFDASPSDVHLSVDLGGELVRTIAIKPPVPTSPAAISNSNDQRRVGIGVVNLRLSSFASGN